MSAAKSFLGGRVLLHKGDCRSIVKEIEPESIDAVVTDPPYHLTSIVKRFGKAGSAAAKSDGPSGVYKRASAGFMGQEWDGGDVAFQPETWARIGETMKPGAHLVAFGGSRTFHRLAVAIEDAGFELRDTLFWIYGSGFPKSHDVSKGIEKRRVEDVEPTREVCRFVRAAMDRQGLKSRHLVEHFDDCHARLIDHWAARDTDSQPNLPTPSQWATLKSVLDLDDSMDAQVAALNARKGEFGDVYGGREIVGKVDEWTDRANYALTSRDGLARGGAVSDEAKAWEGWGTALKPAFEPIILARKPLVGTVAANVLAHGTGALNIDACRIGDGEERRTLPGGMAHKGSPVFGEFANKDRGTEVTTTLGRWPANILHDGEAFGDAEWARYFYTAKADAEDRVASRHPTVKPVELMQWLCRLITPRGGTILDPFAGSGTTGAAAFREGFSAKLIELGETHCEDIARRMAFESEGPDGKRRLIAKHKASTDEEPLPLFGALA